MRLPEAPREIFDRPTEEDLRYYNSLAFNQTQPYPENPPDELLKKLSRLERGGYIRRSPDGKSYMKINRDQFSMTDFLIREQDAETERFNKRIAGAVQSENQAIKSESPAEQRKPSDPYQILRELITKTNKAAEEGIFDVIGKFYPIDDICRALGISEKQQLIEMFGGIEEDNPEIGGFLAVKSPTGEITGYKLINAGMAQSDLHDLLTPHVRGTQLAKIETGSKPQQGKKNRVKKITFAETRQTAQTLAKWVREQNAEQKTPTRDELVLKIGRENPDYNPNAVETAIRNLSFFGIRPTKIKVDGKIRHIYNR